ncbi:MAG TPA: hypothetical protein VJK53_00880 [Candidatus Paceibacterota bacterium]
MWAIAMTVNTFVWVLLGILLVYCAGTAILEGEWRLFVFVAILWALSNVTEVIFATQA